MWAPDPFGRYPQRYYDGIAWTAHVVDNNGQVAVDPLGTTMSIPFATPTARTASPSEVRGQGLRGFLAQLGPEARDRPRVRLSIALAGAGGAAAAAGIAVAIVGDGDSNRGRNVAAAVTIVALAYLIRFLVKTQTEMRSAAVGAAAVGLPALAFAITNVENGGGTLLLAAALLIGAWALPGLRGRPLLLGSGAASIVLALTTIGGDSAFTDNSFNVGPAQTVGGSSGLFVLAAIVLLAMIWWLDTAGFHGVGTSLVIAAILASALAVLKVIENFTSTAGAVLATVAGLAVALVGDHGQRRASTWLGVAITAIGAITTLASALEPGSTADIATVLILGGLALVLVPAVVKALRASRTPVEPSPPFG